MTPRLDDPYQAIEVLLAVDVTGWNANAVRIAMHAALRQGEPMSANRLGDDVCLHPATVRKFLAQLEERRVLRVAAPAAGTRGKTYELNPDTSSWNVRWAIGNPGLIFAAEDRAQERLGRESRYRGQDALGRENRRRAQRAAGRSRGANPASRPSGLWGASTASRPSTSRRARPALAPVPDDPEPGSFLLEDEPLYDERDDALAGAGAAAEREVDALKERILARLTAMGCHPSKVAGVSGHPAKKLLWLHAKYGAALLGRTIDQVENTGGVPSFIDRLALVLAEHERAQARAAAQPTREHYSDDQAEALEEETDEDRERVRQDIAATRASLGRGKMATG